MLRAIEGRKKLIKMLEKYDSKDSKREIARLENEIEEIREKMRRLAE